MKRGRAVAIIGGGRVGCALGRALADAGWNLQAVSSRTAASARRAASYVGAQAAGMAEAAQGADLVVVAVPDDAVGAAARAILPGLGRGAVVAHTSGVLSSDALAAVRRRGARAASWHPLMTMPTPDAGRRGLRGAHFFHEGDPGTDAALRAATRAVGGIPVRVSRARKASYHAGAVLACNDLVALLDSAFRQFRRAGVPEKTTLAALGPLVKRTLENVLKMGSKRALTGPVARGDAGTIALHLRALDGLDRDVYRALGRATLRLASLPAARRRTLERLFAGGTR